MIVVGRNADDVRAERAALAAGAPGRRVIDVAADVSSEADNDRVCSRSWQKSSAGSTCSSATPAFWARRG